LGEYLAKLNNSAVYSINLNLVVPEEDGVGGYVFLLIAIII
jgi:hypothetical protein